MVELSGGDEFGIGLDEPLHAVMATILDTAPTTREAVMVGTRGLSTREEAGLAHALPLAALPILVHGVVRVCRLTPPTLDIGDSDRAVDAARIR